MPDQQVIDRAVELGWRPLPADPDHPTDKEYKGVPEKFVEAEEYIERGEKVLPIVQAHNKKLDAEEIFEEIISLLHSYSMKLYSKRHHDKKKIEISSEDKNNGIRHDIELKEKDEIVEITQIPLVNKDDMKGENS